MCQDGHVICDFFGNLDVRESIGHLVGGLFAMSADAVRFAFRRPFQWQEFISQAWFVARVSLAPTLLVAIPASVALMALGAGRP